MMGTGSPSAKGVLVEKSRDGDASEQIESIELF